MARTTSSFSSKLYSIRLPLLARGEAVQFSWTQASGFGDNQSPWQLDNVALLFAQETDSLLDTFNRPLQSRAALFYSGGRIEVRNFNIASCVSIVIRVQCICRLVYVTLKMNGCCSLEVIGFYLSMYSPSHFHLALMVYQKHVQLLVSVDQVDTVIILTLGLTGITLAHVYLRSYTWCVCLSYLFYNPQVKVCTHV